MNLAKKAEKKAKVIVEEMGGYITPRAVHDYVRDAVKAVYKDVIKLAKSEKVNNHMFTTTVLVQELEKKMNKYE